MPIAGLTDQHTIETDLRLHRWPISLRLPLKPWRYPLRRWQAEAFRTFLSGAENFLAVATPGAGKTIFALRAIHHLLLEKVIERVVVVVPTDNLRGQWMQAAASNAGVQLDSGWTNGPAPETNDYHGAVVTYQQVGSNPQASRRHCAARRTLVVFDEIHHVGDANTWGGAVQSAFGPAIRRLGLSGTPFRTDGEPIPFIRYDEDGRSVPDYVYGYGDALADGVCRPVLFSSYDGEMEWSLDGVTVNKTFKDTLDAKSRVHRLRTALDPGGEWLDRVVRDADRKLLALRGNGHSAAGGLIIAIDQEHARAIARLLERLTYQTPTVVISDEPRASAQINEFKRGHQRWIIAVRMISEGVDIPRLRVGIYATNVRSELFFRQAVGRFIRMQAELKGDQSAYLYIPREDVLLSLAQKIKQEVAHKLRDKVERGERGEREPTQSELPLFTPLSSAAQADDVVYDASLFSQTELARAQTLKLLAGLPAGVDDALIAAVIRAYEAQKGVGIRAGITAAARAAKPAPVANPIREEIGDKRRLVSKLVNRLHYEGDGQHHQREIFAALSRHDGVSQGQCTLAQLDARVALLKNWLERGMPQ
ncbi:MAG: ATP-dependent helicase [Chloroflexi bacterium]|nr:MAG: ATP-dependent helicase [Chloroflexota bacterium]